MSFLFVVLIVLCIVATIAGYNLGHRRQYARKLSSPSHETKQNLDEKGSRGPAGYGESQQEGLFSQGIEPLENFDWRATEPHKLRPFKPKYHITMGQKAPTLQTDTPSELITIDHDYYDRVMARRNTVKEHGPTVIGCVPRGRAAVRELYSYLLGGYLPVRFPTMFQLEHQSGDQHGTDFVNKVTGLRVPLAPAQDEPLVALETIAETVEDDIFLLLQREQQDNGEPGEHEAVAFVCCHPSGFDPSEKLGKVLRDVHGPVPAYDKIGPSMERFFSRLEVGRSAKRANWGVQTHTDLFAPSGNHVYVGEEVEEDSAVDAESARLRVELQTLTRLPKTKAILFSFKTYLYPLAEIKAEGLGPQLADAIEGLKAGNAPGMWVYKGSVRWGKAVCEFLRSH
ncbi:hypothetical protein B0H67DRAFT_479811 [Lasiosphaeris hirsuta]|uniref:Uncharacterized protein n=1 Tax=Lasiosphaeris hirsuta TaxID=260670 RepID=A0AA40AZ32_9PEZI|nr:hypothetical protein B0H67DRAFT_479811 [Lasiosphaeris hirsuta]